MSSTSSESKPKLDRGEELAGWTVIRRIGSGGFGTVYEVEKDGERAAMKTEFVYEKHSEALRNEVKQLRLLQFSPHFCRLILACRQIHKTESYVNIMVMQLVGRSLSALRKQMPKQLFTEETSIRLAKQCLQALQDMHSVGLIHRDVKAANFAWNPEGRRVYLLDLGFCRRYLEVSTSADGLLQARHRPARRGLPFSGTEKYCSMNVHNRREQSRRDDLWSWIYTTVEFLVGRLEWAEYKEHEVYRRKAAAGSGLFLNCPRQLIACYDHIRFLNYESRPNYELLHRQLDRILKEQNVKETDPMDWELGGCQFEWLRDQKLVRKDGEQRPKEIHYVEWDTSSARSEDSQPTTVQ